jgi:phage shock protein A
MDVFKQYADAELALAEAKIKVYFAKTIAQKEYLEALTELDKWTKRYKLAFNQNRHDLIDPVKIQIEKYYALAKRLANICDEQMPHLNDISEYLKYRESQINNN